MTPSFKSGRPSGDLFSSTLKMKLDKKSTASGWKSSIVRCVKKPGRLNNPSKSPRDISGSHHGAAIYTNQGEQVKKTSLEKTYQTR